MAKAYVKRHYTLEEEEIQAILVKAKTKDEEAQRRLLEVFDNYLRKYSTFLYTGKYNVNDYDVRRFLSLFVPNKLAVTELRRNKMSPSSRVHVNDTIRRITGMAQRYGTEVDAKQTVDMTFLQCVDRYERKGDIPFAGFLVNYFLFLLKKNVDMFLQDQVGRKTFPLITEEDRSEQESSEEESIPGFEAPPMDTPLDNLIGPDMIDEHWVSGETATFPFSDLNIQERQLLKWRFADDLRSSDIAKKTTEHPNTVREHFHRMKRKLEDILKQDIDLYI